MGGAWVNFHSSVTEGFGFSILEASVRGTPTVAYSVPDVKEAVGNGENRILVRDGNREDALEAVVRIINAGPNSWSAKSAETVKKYS